MEKRQNFWLASILFFVLVMPLSLAQTERTFDTQKAYNWLSSQAVEGAYNEDVFVTSWAILAFSAANLYTDADASLNWLLLQQEDGCFPKGNCKTKDTALAVLALKAMDTTQDFPQTESFYKELLAPSPVGSHYLQVTGVSAPVSGTCTLSYTVQNSTDFTDVVLVNGRFQNCGNSTFLNLDNCVKPNLLKANPGLNINADCADVEGGKIITYLAQAGNTYYLVSSEERDVVDISVKNGCFGRGKGDTCNADASLYANYALRKLQSDLDISIYLRESYENSNAEQLALLYLSIQDAELLKQVKKLQSSDGSWEKNPYKTALALLALQNDPITYEREIDKGRNFLALKQGDDGSIQGNVLATSAALYATFNEGVSETGEEAQCGDGSCNGDEDEFSCPEDCQTQESCNFNGDCESDLGENSETCSTDCPGAATAEEDCVVNGQCDVRYGEDSGNCPADCTCGDDVCDTKEDEDSCPGDCKPKEETIVECGNSLCEEGEDVSCPSDCEAPATESSSWGTVIFVILLLLLLGGGGYFAYKKGLIKFKPKGPSEEPRQQPYKPFSSKQSFIPPAQPQQARRLNQQPQRKQRTADDELEKSIEEARKLLGK